MRAEHLMMWHPAEKREENHNPGNWEKVVAIIQEAFRGGELAAPCAYQTVVMIPKGVGTDFMGISLVEVLWKTISGIINLRLSPFIEFHNTLHGFYSGRGTGTATLEEKFLQKLIAIREMVIHAILRNLSKAYDYLDRDRCLDILAGHGLGPRMFLILRTYWVRIQMAAKAGSHYGPAFQSRYGVTQG